MEESEISRKCGSALLGVDECLAPAVRFPRNVFVGPWGYYFFFDSDRIFESAFVNQVKMLLHIEGSSCACLVNLDASAETASSHRRFFIDRSTAPNSYKDFIKGERPGQGWIHSIDRFGCASNLCQWAVYCERGSEIAVIAIRSQFAFDRYSLPLSGLKAVRIRDAVSKPISYGFSPEALSTEWRNVLIHEYDSVK